MQSLKQGLYYITNVLQSVRSQLFKIDDEVTFNVQQ